MSRIFNWFCFALATAALLFGAPAKAGSGDFDHVDTAVLSGGVLNGAAPKGKAELRTRGNTVTQQSFRKLTVEAQNVSLADGTTLSVAATDARTGVGTVLGTMKAALGRAKLEIDERDGGLLAPFAPLRTVLEVSVNGTVILSGEF